MNTEVAAGSGRASEGAGEVSILRISSGLLVALLVGVVVLLAAPMVQPGIGPDSLNDGWGFVGSSLVAVVLFRLVALRLETPRGRQATSRQIAVWLLLGFVVAVAGWHIFGVLATGLLG